MKKYPTTAIRLDQGDKNLLVRLAEKEGKNRSAIMRDLIRREAYAKGINPNI